MKNEESELVGLIFGDGSLTFRPNKKLRFQLRGHAVDDREHYISYIIPLLKRILPRSICVVESHKSHKSFGVACENQLNCNFIHSLGVPIGVKHNLTIPLWILNNYMVDFIRGFFDTDGSIYCDKNYSVSQPRHYTQIRIKLVSISEQMMTQISNFLHYISIKHMFYSYEAINRKKAYFIKISGRIQVKKWFSIIGSHNPKHIRKYEDFLNTGAIQKH